MKKFLLILGVLCSIVFICIGVYILFKIYFIVSSIDGNLYDGFGVAYSFGKPHSPYTIVGIIAFFCGSSLLSYFYGKLKGENKDEK